jgi:galactokinase
VNAPAGHDVSRLIDRARAVFERHFGGTPTVVGAAPGRVNLIGEHTDYNDGLVLPMAIERHTVLVGAVNHSARCRVIAADLDEQRAAFMIDDPAPGRTPWANYIKGVIAQFIRHGQRAPAFDAVIAGDLPLGGGLSSSAAMEVATATALEQFLGIEVDPVRKALWCQAAEREFAGVPCGIMDQFIAVMGRAQHALLIDCRNHAMQPVPLDDPAVTVLIANTNVRHELAGSAYAERRAQCEQAAEALAEHFGASIRTLRDATMQQLDLIRSQLDEAVYRRARHVIGEIERTRLAADHLDARDYDQVGRLMNESHRSLRDDFEVSCAELDTLVDLARQADGVFGCRMTGAGFGGCTVMLVRAEAVEALIDRLETEYTSRHGRAPTCFASRPADGARGGGLR